MTINHDSFCNMPRLTISREQTPHWKRTPAKGRLCAEVYVNQVGGHASFDIEEWCEDTRKSNRVMFTLDREEVRGLHELLSLLLEQEAA